MYNAVPKCGTTSLLTALHNLSAVNGFGMAAHFRMAMCPTREEDRKFCEQEHVRTPRQAVCLTTWFR